MSSKDLEESPKTQENRWDDMIEYLRCHYCNGYLSCSPLRILPDGHSVCGRCEPPINGVSIYRMLDVENSLSKVTFPCRFKNNGCSKRTLFGHVFEHESICDYQTITCFAVPLGSCNWAGRIFDISQHFVEIHQQNWMKEKQQFEVVVEEDANQKMVVFEKRNIITIIQYSYNSLKKELTYYIQYLTLDVGIPFYNIELSNGELQRFSMNIKVVPYRYQQPDVIASQKVTTINLKPYIDILNSPDIITFSVNLILEEGITPALNYDLLESLKCTFCEIYITPPLYKSNAGLLCSYCGKNKCNSYEDRELEALMAKANYPCRWKNCNAVKKVDDIRSHETDCMYRRFDCPVPGCTKIYKRGKVIDHFEEHHEDHRKGEERIIFDFYVNSCCQRKFYMVQNNEVVAINCRNELETFYFEQYSCSLENPSVYGYFEDWSCKVKSKNYCMSLLNSVTNYLPCCLKRTKEGYNTNYSAVLTVRW